MATLRLVVVLDPANLLDRAIEGLFPLAPATAESPWPTLSAWVFLRQGGLRDDLHRLAASHGVAGWFDPTVGVFSELPTRFSLDTRASLTAPERVALLTGVIATLGAGTFDRGGAVEPWVPPIDRLIGELISEGIAPNDFAAALKQRAGRDTFEVQRDTALAAIYSAWCSKLRALDLVDGRDGLVRLAADISRAPAEFAEHLGGRRDIRFIGLADLRGGWRTLLGALQRTPALETVSIYTSHALELPSELHAVIEIPRAEHSLASALFSDVTAAAGNVQLVEAPDAAREIEIVAVRVRALIDADVHPARIAVLPREARPAVDQMAEALERLGVPVTARRRTTLAQTGPASALRALLAAAEGKFDRHALIELAEHPLLALGFDAAVLNFVGYLSPVENYDGWLTALADLTLRCRQRDDGRHRDDYRHPLPATARAESMLAAWQSWKPEAVRLVAQRTSTEWFAWIVEILTDPRWKIHEALAKAPADDNRIWRADCKARERLVTLAHDWQDAYAQHGVNDQHMDAAHFAQRFDLALQEDLVTLPETGFGVVVAEALAAGWRAFDHVFVIGLAAGNFPRRIPPSPVLGEQERGALVGAGIRIDPPDAWRVRERELFRVLCAAPRTQLTLSWPAMAGDGREAARSAFVDEVMTASGLDDDAVQRVPSENTVTAGYPVLAHVNAEAALRHARRVAAIEGDRTEDLSPWNGDIKDPSLIAALSKRYGEPYPWSATQLEGLAKCPWSWFAQRVLKIEERSEADESIEPSESGTILHDALHRFFGQVGDERGRPVYLRAIDLIWAQPTLDAALDAAWAAREKEYWLGTPALRPVAKEELRHQLRKYLDFEIDYNEKSYKSNTNASKQVRTGAESGELQFGPVELDGREVRFRLHGTIDRVDRGTDDRVTGAARYIAAIEYKSSRGSTPAGGDKAGWDDGVVLQLPLYAQVLRQLHGQDVLARIEYRTLRSPQVVHALSFARVNTSEVEPSDEADTKLASALQSAGHHIAAVRSGRMPTAPKDSTGCSAYCVARDFCRIPGGPRG